MAKDLTFYWRYLKWLTHRGYGIDRSGMTRAEYCDVITSTFSKFYHFADAAFEMRPISGIDRLFEKYSEPRQIGSIILI